MSDDDLVRRGDVRALIVRTGMSDGDYFAEKLDTVPAASSSASAPAERLARAADADAAAYAAFAAAISRGEDWRPFDAPATKSREEFMSALAAFRAAPEPAKPEPCAGCHDIGVNCANPRCNYMVPCGSICNKCGTITPKCAAPKPEPCRTCGGAGWLWRHEHPEYREIPMEDLHDDTRYACPACRPGGAA